MASVRSPSKGPTGRGTGAGGGEGRVLSNWAPREGVKKGRRRTGGREQAAFVGGGGRGGAGGLVASPGRWVPLQRPQDTTDSTPKGQVSGYPASSTWFTTGGVLVCGALVTLVLSIPAAAGVKRP